MKKILTLCIVLILCSFLGIAKAEINNVKVETRIENQIERDYKFDFLNLNDINTELSSQLYTVGCIIDIGDNLKITPRIGIWDSELNISDLVTLENSVGLAAGISGEYKLAKLKDDLSISLIGDYLFAHSEIDKIRIKNIGISNPIRNDIYRNDLEGGVKVTYSGIPMNAVASLAAVYSYSTIDINANLAIIDLDIELEAKDAFGLRPAINFTPYENWEVSLEAKLVDQEAIVGKISYKF